MLIPKPTEWTPEKMPKDKCLEHLIQYESTNWHYWTDSSQQWNLGTSHHPRDKDRLPNIEMHHLPLPPQKNQMNQLCAQNYGHGLPGWQKHSAVGFSPHRWDNQCCPLLQHTIQCEKLFEERYQNSSTLVLTSSIVVQHPTQPRQPNTG
jgi:hypothetical protein